MRRRRAAYAALHGRRAEFVDLRFRSINALIPCSSQLQGAAVAVTTAARCKFTLEVPAGFPPDGTGVIFNEGLLLQEFKSNALSLKSVFSSSIQSGWSASKVQAEEVIRVIR